MATVIELSDSIIARAWSVDGDQASVQRFWYDVTSITGTSTTDQIMADQLETTLAPLYKPLLNNIAEWRGVQVQIYRDNAIFSEVSSIAHAGVGTGGALPLPRQSSGIISWGSARAGRRFRGRMYIPFPSTTADTGDGIPTSAYQVALQTLADAWRQSVFFGSVGSAIQAEPFLKHSPGKTPIPATVTHITTGDANLKWATQRRRGSYGRINSSPI